MEKLRYALIGCGRIAPNHIAAALHNADTLDLAAVCDPVPERMEQVLVACPDAPRVRRYVDYREMLAREAPALVAVATESGSHARIAFGCLSAGCHVIVEKPVALSLADADRLIETARTRGLKLAVCHQNRFNKSVRKIRAALDAGRFGRLYSGSANIRWNRGPGYYRQAPWRGTWGQDGGCLMNQCIHNIDLLRWMMGDDVDEVMAFTDNLAHPYIEAEDIGMAVVRFSNGAYGTIEGTVNVYPQNLEETLYLFGEKGTVKAGGRSVNILEEWRFGDGLDDPEEVKRAFGENPPNVYGYGHTPLYRDMVAAIRENRPPLVDGAAGRRALELVLAMYLSAARGAPVKLPLMDCATSDFTGRFSGRAR